MIINRYAKGGGLSPRIVVTTTTGSTVTCTKGGTTLTATEVSGKWTFNLNDFGTWTVNATLGDKSATKDVDVEWAQVYEVVMKYVSTTLNDNDWATIRDIADASEGANYWSVGDTKQITINGKLSDGLTLSNYQTYVYIIGFDHNEAVEGKGIAFGGFKTAQSNGTDVCLCDSGYRSNKSSGQWFNMNNNNSNSSGWSGCNMRNNTLPVVKVALPSDLQAVLKMTTIYSDNTGGGNDTASYVTATKDDLYLLAEFEIFGVRTYANSAERNYQQQYAYYAAGNSKIKYQHNNTATAARWWGRSVYVTGNIFFCCVEADGVSGAPYAMESCGMAPAFKVGSNNILYLYNEGNECTDVTGGWITGKLDQATFSPTPIDGIKQEDSLKVPMTYGGGFKYSGFRTTNLIDWTSYGWINIEFSYQITQTGDPTDIPVFQLSLQNNAMSTDLELNSGSIVAALSQWTGKGDTKIGIPNSVGTYSYRVSAKLPPINLAYDIPTPPSYLLALIGWWWSVNSAAANVTIKKIWLE